MRYFVIFACILGLFLNSCEDPNGPDTPAEYEVTFSYPESQLNHIFDIEVERGEVYVCGFENGVHKFDYDFSLLDLEVNNYNTIFENITFHNSEIWVSTADGLYFNNGNESFVFDSGNTELHFDHVFDIKFISEYKALVANKGGLYEFNIKTKKFQKIQLPDVSDHIEPPYPPSDSFPFRIHLSKNGDIWVGFMSGGLFHRSNGEWIHYNKDNSALNSNAIRSIIETKNGDIYVGQWKGGVCKFSGGQSSKFDLSIGEEALDSDKLEVWAMELDKNDNLWIGTWGDVLLYDFWKQELSVFGNEELGFGLKVRDLKKDIDGNILMGLESNGLVEIKINNQE